LAYVGAGIVQPVLNKLFLYSLGKLGRPFKVSFLLYLLEIEQDKICVGI
jgi:hypothetical protein